MHVAKYDACRKTWSLRGAPLRRGGYVSIGGVVGRLDFVMPHVTRWGALSKVHHMTGTDGRPFTFGQSGHSVYRCACARGRD